MSASGSPCLGSLVHSLDTCQWWTSPSLSMAMRWRQVLGAGPLCFPPKFQWLCHDCIPLEVRVGKGSGGTVVHPQIMHLISEKIVLHFPTSRWFQEATIRSSEELKVLCSTWFDKKEKWLPNFLWPSSFKGGSISFLQELKWLLKLEPSFYYFYEM